MTTLNLLGGTLQLSVNGSANVTNIVATTVGTAGTTTVNILSIVHATTGVTYPLISYGSGNPFGTLSLGSLPSGAVGNLVNDITFRYALPGL